MATPLSLSKTTEVVAKHSIEKMIELRSRNLNKFINVWGKMLAEGLHKAVSLDLSQPQGAQVVRPRVVWGM